MTEEMIVKRKKELARWERRILPFTLQEEVELATGTREEDDELALMLASPAYSVETGPSEGVEKTGILILCLLGLLPGLLF